jgi:cell division protein ZapA (FtsZ GTPase activity inhibitor)
MPASDLRLDILGTSFSITADEDADYLENIFSQYRLAVENTQHTTNLKDPLKVAILTGFLLCDEIHKLRGSNEPGEAAEAEQRTLNLIARIDEVLENKSPGNECSF